MEPESALITKLHAQLSLIRRDRDDAHRRAELAAERARIVKKDRENAAAEVEGMRRKLVEMKEETKRKEKEVGKMEKEVESLNMEYKFQHSELQSKREKLSHLSTKVSSASSSRNTTINSSREALRKRRDNSSSLNAPNLSLEEKKRQIVALLEGEGAEEWMAALPEWIVKRTEGVWEESEDVRRDCVALERKIYGYHAALEHEVFGGDVAVGEQ